jgi:hypothetical protein
MNDLDFCKSDISWKDDSWNKAGKFSNAVTREKSIDFTNHIIANLLSNGIANEKE